MKKILSGLLFTVTLPIWFFIWFGVSVFYCVKYKGLAYLCVAFSCVGNTYKSIAKTGQWFNDKKESENANHYKEN